METEQAEINDIEQEIMNALEELNETIREAPPTPDTQGDMDGDVSDLYIRDMDQDFEFSGHIEPKTIKAWLQGVGSIVDEAKVHITRQGWNIKAVDPAHVCMIDMTLNKSAWHDYKCIGDESIGIDIDKILEVIKAAKKGDSVGFKICDAKITMTAGIIQMEIIPVDTTGMSEPKVPNLNLPGEYQINHEYLETAIKQCGTVSDCATITADEKGITISAGNDEYGTARADIPKEYLAFLRIKESIQSKFPLDYLGILSRAAKMGMLLKGQDLTVHMGNDYPIKVEAGTDDWEITYLLAPQIEQ